MGGPCAGVSTFLLRQESYGLERDDALLDQRLLEECVHELGHTLDLGHCRDYRCVMASSEAVKPTDLRQSSLCPDCRWRLESSAHLRAADGTEAHHKLPSA